MVHLVPKIIEALRDRIIVDISLGDGHCLALTNGNQISLVMFFVYNLPYQSNRYNIATSIFTSFYIRQAKDSTNTAHDPTCIFLKFNGNIRIMCEICPKVTIRTPERRFIDDVLVSLLLALSRFLIDLMFTLLTLKK